MSVRCTALSRLGVPRPSTVPSGSGRLQQLPSYESLCGDGRKRAGSRVSSLRGLSGAADFRPRRAHGPGVCFLRKHAEDTDSYQTTGVLGVERPFLPSQFPPRWRVPGNSHPVQGSFGLLEFSGSAVRPDLRP